MNQKPQPQRCAPKALGIILAAALCGFAAQARALDLNEAPKLAARVAAGTLPPVDERVPEQPRVIKVAEPENMAATCASSWAAIKTRA